MDIGQARGVALNVDLNSHSSGSMPRVITVRWKFARAANHWFLSDRLGPLKRIALINRAGKTGSIFSNKNWWVSTSFYFNNLLNSTPVLFHSAGNFARVPICAFFQFLDNAGMIFLVAILA